MARSASELFGRARSKGWSRIGSGLAIIKMNQNKMIVLEPVKAIEKTPHVAINMQRPDYTTAPTVKQGVVMFFMTSLSPARWFFFVFDQLRLLFWRQVTNNNLTFGNHLDLEINRDFAVESDRHCKLTQPLQWFAQMDTMAIDLITTLFQGLGQIH